MVALTRLEGGKTVVRLMKSAFYACVQRTSPNAAPSTIFRIRVRRGTRLPGVEPGETPRPWEHTVPDPDRYFRSDLGRALDELLC